MAFAFLYLSELIATSLNAGAFYAMLFVVPTLVMGVTSYLACKRDGVGPRQGETKLWQDRNGDARETSMTAGGILLWFGPNFRSYEARPAHLN